MRKSKKSVLLNIILSLCLCLTLFMGSFMTADAAYMTGRFPFDMSMVPGSTIEEYPYIYLFKVRGSSTVQNPGKQYAPNPLGSLGNYSTYGSFFHQADKLCAVFSDKELVLYTDSPDVEQPIIILNSKPGETARFLWMESDNGVKLDKYVTSSPNLLPGGVYLTACYFNPRMVYVMSNTDIRSADTGEVLYSRNIADSWIADRKNVSDVSTPDDVDISNNTSTSSGGVELLPEESDGTLWGNLFSYFAKTVNGIANLGNNITKSLEKFANSILDGFVSNMEKLRQAFLTLIGNVKELPDKFVESMNSGEPFSFFDAIFDNINLKIVDIIKGIRDIPKDIADAFLSGKLSEYIEGILDHVIGLPSAIIDLFTDSPIYQLIKDMASPVVSIATNLMNIPVEIGKEIGKTISSVFEKLFIPDSLYFQAKIDDLGDRFPLIESMRAIVFSLSTRIKALGSNPPVISVPLSKTFLGAYGVADCSISFEWFAPYRPMVFLVEGAFLWGMFAFRLFFGIKHIFNATSNLAPYMYIESWRV
ncbi:MAG: hypothetical protein NC251_13470 [Lachnoclostridium sp.]|nr:hypothetical protein [Lachnospira sp.]MCM1249420.1 hypothetical protein [Lachnoclostridium sp.]